ncbi:MAG: hypothetical protein H6728_04315 [Myxococcales bacterium]|nr:hypothetical protein [Myxococcales bacterium]MCB9642276.1 hypothetical protein [Myxococcales bacterium]
MTATVREERFQVLREQLAEQARKLREAMPIEADGLWDDGQVPQRLLSSRAMRVWLGIAEALLDDGEGGPTPSQLSWFERELNDFFASSAGLPRLVLQALPWLFEASPLLSGTAVLPFSMLGKAKRLRCLERMEHGPVPPLGMVVFMAKTLVCTIFFEHPEAQTRLDFDGRCLVDEHREQVFQKQILH